MPDRLAWQKGDRPQHFIATMPEGIAEIWHQETGAGGVKGWRYRIKIGDTVHIFTATDKQQAADEANRAWPNVLREERARAGKIEAQDRLEEQLERAHSTGRVDVAAFALGGSKYQRLVDMLDFIRRRGWLGGPLKPLVEAVSNELYRRRTGGP
jgi:hypothetical protein